VRALFSPHVVTDLPDTTKFSSDERTVMRIELSRSPAIASSFSRCSRAMMDAQRAHSDRSHHSTQVMISSAQEKRLF
jgi:hypothetical protein